MLPGRLKAALVLALMWIFCPGFAGAATITSANFSVAFGATYISGAVVSWTPLENTTLNTTTTIGNFSFVPTIPSGRAFTQNGPTFVNGALSTGGTTNVTGNATDFELRLTGSYDGVVPPGATGVTLTVNITRLSIWGWSSSTHTTVTNLDFRETTPGHAASSPSINLRSGSFSAAAVANAANYTQIIWNPADFAVALTAATRTFNINGGGVPLCVEGLTIQGNVVLTYTPAAQPPPVTPPVAGQGTLLADPFATAYTGDQQNTELLRQAGALAPLTYSDLPNAGNSWQSRLTGPGLALYPSSADPAPGLRGDHNFTDSDWLRFSVDIDAIADGYWGGLAIGCGAGAKDVFDTNGFAVRVYSSGSVSVLSQGTQFLNSSVTASDGYHLEIEAATPSGYDGSGATTLKVSINGQSIDLNGAAPGVSISRPGLVANYALIEATKDLPGAVAAARFRNFIVLDMRPPLASAGTLLHDTFNSAYTGYDVNQGTARQSGTLAPLTYSKVSNDPSGGWRSELNGRGILLNASSGYLAAVRTDANFTNLGQMSYSVCIAPSDYRPHNRFGIGCGPLDMDPNISPTGLGVMIWRDSGHLFVYDRGTTIFDGLIPATSNYRVQLEVDTPPAYDGSGTAVIALTVNGIPIDLNGIGEGTSFRRPGFTVNHILMTSYIAAAAGTNTVFDDLLVTTMDSPFVPGLQITPAPSNSLTVSWPAIATGWQLEKTSSLGSPDWTPVVEAALVDGTNRNTVLASSGQAGFFRLRLNSANQNLTNDAAAVNVITPESQVLVATNGGLWPTLLLLPNGDLLAFGHNKPGHTTLPGDEDCWASVDNGSSWQKRATAAARASTNANWVDSCAGLATNADVLLLTGGYTDPGGARRAPAAPAVFRSSDNGFTLRQRGFFPASLPRGETTRPYGQIVRGVDGTLRTIAYDQFGTGSAYQLISRDDGLNWGEPTEIAVGINESVLLEISAGHWLAIGRTVAKPTPDNGQELRQYRSRNNGQSWSDEHLVAGYSKHPPKLTRLQDGRLLLSYCNRRNGAIEVRFSSNEGETWNAPFSVAQTGGDRGYPDSVQLANGKIVTVYYAQSTSLHAGYQLAAVVWTPPL